MKSTMKPAASPKPKGNPTKSKPRPMGGTKGLPAVSGGKPKQKVSK